ncbi:H-NS histone family protein [Hylemonella gracilis]|uniref:Histone family protein nucleoid-structuring protein H-NS n=1 Tax=Hylemonella gracilis ATCC 19624 TaxID=887062 RepID=F3KWI4_9BURK|nr:H-NS histone family protein [Hylemonella gracilis]EGI75854.1 histone family protein nucleoid-structuring protein H-NS [Hylemonella gracilis ATCC 19624]
MSLEINTLSLEQLEAQKASYEKRIAELRQQERDAALQTVRELVAKHKFTAKEISQPTASAQSADAVEPKYRNPETGETWSGRGRAPAWLEGANKDEFLVATA